MTGVCTAQGFLQDSDGPLDARRDGRQQARQDEPDHQDAGEQRDADGDDSPLERAHLTQKYEDETFWTSERYGAAVSNRAPLSFSLALTPSGVTINSA